MPRKSVADTSVKVFADITNRQLVAAINNTGEKRLDSPKPPGHQDKLYISVQALVINPSATGQSNPYTALTTSGFSLIVTIYKKSDGSTLAGPFTSWTTDGTTVKGSVNLFSTDMNNAVAALSADQTLTTSIEFQLTDADSETTIRQDFQVKKSFTTAGTPPAVPGVRYLTDADESRYVKYSGNPNGSSITIPSEDGSKANVLFTDDNGVFQAQPES